MSSTTVALYRAVIRASHPWALLAGILLYALGGGISKYLGYGVDWPVYWIGQASVTLLQLSSFFLREYFDRATQPPFEPPVVRTRPRPPVAPRLPVAPRPDDGRTPDEPEPEPLVIIPRVIFLQIAAATLTIGAVLTVLLVAQHKLNPPALIFLGIAFVLAVVYAVPPFRLVYSGYGELVMAIMVANLFPALAVLFQAGTLTHLLAMLTFPLTLLYLAATLALSLQSYYDDVKHERQTMMARLGWQRGMSLHNALIALAYVSLAIFAIVGLPLRLAYPAFLSLPVGVFEIWQMNSIASGASPRWRMLAITALAMVGLAVYFMNLAIWTG